MQPVLLWPRPHSAIAEYLERSPDDFTVVDSLEEIKTEGGHLAADNFSYKTDRALPYSCLRIPHTQADHG